MHIDVQTNDASSEQIAALLRQLSPPPHAPDWKHATDWNAEQQVLRIGTMGPPDRALAVVAALLLASDVPWSAITIRRGTDMNKVRS